LNEEEEKEEEEEEILHETLTGWEIMLK